MRNIPIQGQDIQTISPVGGVIHVGGIVRSPRDVVSILWEVDNASGSTQCEAWRGQYEIECLTLAGYKILEVSVQRYA